MADLKATTIRGDLSVKGNVNASNLYPVDSVFITSTNTNPKNLLGFGTWTLIDKEFKPVDYYYITDQTKVKDYVTPIKGTGNAGDRIENIHIRWTRSGHTLRFQIEGTPGSNWNFGTSIDTCLVHYEAFGAKRIGCAFPEITGACHDRFSVVLATLTNGESGATYAEAGVEKTAAEGTGVLRRRNIIRYNYTKGNTVPFVNNSTTKDKISWNFVTPIHYKHMLDSACNKFYWKRTA